MQEQMDGERLCHNDFRIFQNIVRGIAVSIAGDLGVCRHIVGVFPVIVDHDVVNAVDPGTGKDGLPQFGDQFRIGRLAQQFIDGIFQHPCPRPEDQQGNDDPGASVHGKIGIA